MNTYYGIIILVMAFIYATLEIRFFGNNWSPKSTAEVIADGIACLIAAIGFLALSLGD